MNNRQNNEQHYIEALQQKKIRLYEIPEDELTDTICIEAMRVRPRDIKDVPEEYWTEKFLAFWLSIDGALEHIPWSLRTPTICLDKLEKSYHDIEHIPGKVRAVILNEEKCVDIVRHNASFLQYIPEKFCNKPVYEAALNSNTVNLRLIPEEISNELLTEAKCLAIIEYDYKQLLNVPSKFFNETFCLAAVEKNKAVLTYVPNEFITEDKAYLDAISSDPNLLIYKKLYAIPDKDKILKAAIKASPQLI
jgi:hypothetical protein